MTSPGGPEVGRISVRVVPDTSGFRARLRRDIERAIAGLEVKIKVDPEVDTAGLKQRIEAALQGIEANIDVGIGTSVAALRAELRTMVARAQRGISADVEVNFRRGLGGILGGGGGGFGGGGGGGGLLGALMPNSLGRVVFYLGAALALAGPLIAAGAAIAAAWGLISTSIMAIPAAIGLIGLPLLTVMAGSDEIKRNLASLKPELDAFKQAANDAFGTSMTYVVSNLRFVMRDLLGDFKILANETGGFMVHLSNVAAEAQNMDYLKLTFQNAAGAMGPLKLAAGSLYGTFIQLTSMKSAWDALTGTIFVFADAFGGMVDRLAANGTLTNAFRGLEMVLGSLSKAFVGLVENGIKLFAAAAPGVSKFFDKLTAFFGKFDWDRLGTAVGRVFEGMGETLGKIDQSTIDKIVEGFEKLGDVFKNPQIQQGFADLVAWIPTVLDALGRMTGAFSGIVQVITGGVMNIQAVLALLRGDISISEFATRIAEGSGKVDAGMTLIKDSITGANLGGAASAEGAKVGPALADGLNSGKPAVDAGAQGLADAAKPKPGFKEGISMAWTIITNGLGLLVGNGLRSETPAVEAGVDEVTKAAAPNEGQKVVMRNGWEQFLFDIGLINEQGLLRVFEKTQSGTANIAGAFASGTAPIPGTVAGNLAPLGSAADAPMGQLNQGITRGWAQGRQETATGARNVSSEAGKVRSMIPAAVGNLGGILISAGRAVMNGLLAGLRAGAGAVLAYARSIAAQVKAIWPFSPAKDPRSPFAGKDWMKVSGQRMMTDWGKGMAEGSSEAISAAYAAAREVQSSFSEVSVTDSKVSTLSSSQISHSITADGATLEDRVAAALSNWSVDIDGNGIARMVNKSNTRRARRG